MTSHAQRFDSGFHGHVQRLRFWIRSVTLMADVPKAVGLALEQFDHGGSNGEGPRAPNLRLLRVFSDRNL